MFGRYIDPKSDLIIYYQGNKNILDMRVLWGYSYPQVSEQVEAYLNRNRATHRNGLTYGSYRGTPERVINSRTAFNVLSGSVNGSTFTNQSKTFKIKKYSHEGLSERNHNQQHTFQQVQMIHRRKKGIESA